MHLPAEMLSGAVCPVSATLSILGVGAAATALIRHPERAPRAADFALVGTTVFALQMLNYPLFEGVSGHLLGGTFAAAVLGVPGGILCLSLVLLVQCLLFADGGLGMLGANVLNMAVIGAGLGGFLLQWMCARGWKRLGAFAFAGAGAVLAATVALCGELALGGRGGAGVAGVLLGTHLAVAAVEGVSTLGLLAVIPEPEAGRALSRRAVLAFGGVLAGALALTPLASAFPDALEWTLERFSLLPNAPNFVAAPFADYAVGALPEGLSTLVAAACGVVAVAAASFALVPLLRRRA